jgi:hypothetical protein
LQLIGFGEAVLLELGRVLAPIGMILVKRIGAVGECAGVVDAAPPAAPKAGIDAAVGKTSVAKPRPARERTVAKTAETAVKAAKTATAETTKTATAEAAKTAAVEAAKTAAECHSALGADPTQVATAPANRRSASSRAGFA